MKPYEHRKQSNEPQLLVVDDDMEIRELLTIYFGAQGFRVASVSDGVAMDAWLAENSADLVILDRNPLKVEPTAIKGIVVVETIKEGHTVFAR